MWGEMSGVFLFLTNLEVRLKPEIQFLAMGDDGTSE